ncbi:predicted protein [Sclerotinia sclerotiorum 1980 UF-70]|uniref:Uncharacterized protein n=1 Tax=Sclerotinia sclerotiorum (strain ATCC 18683 / 1980 / Ss-1) TaxID=665079 RepID=A7ELN9_SCLS1|nr:predicted protein [Sclerotinia sclerotiorum 1980 UF-70]EDO03755.1 predicted protein [Sclerotinia sclerotiorum 1980 UF-70]
MYFVSGPYFFIFPCLCLPEYLGIFIRNDPSNQPPSGLVHLVNDHVITFRNEMDEARAERALLKY